MGRVFLAPVIGVSRVTDVTADSLTSQLCPTPATRARKPWRLSVCVCSVCVWDVCVCVGCVCVCVFVPGSAATFSAYSLVEGRAGTSGSMFRIRFL